MGRVTVEVLSELAACARGNPTRAGFRAEAVARLRASIGFDGVAWGPIPAGAQETPLEYYGEHMSGESIASMALDPAARADITRSQRFLEAHGVAVDGGFTATDKRRSSFFMDYLAPLGVGTYVSIDLRRGPGATAVRLTRERKPFAAREVSMLRGVQPVLRLCEDLFDARYRERANACPLRASLSPREREIAELVCRGLRNQDIAALLGLSVHTVRNHLQRIFDRQSLASRTELAVAFSRGQP